MLDLVAARAAKEALTDAAEVDYETTDRNAAFVSKAAAPRCWLGPKPWCRWRPTPRWTR